MRTPRITPATGNSGAKAAEPHPELASLEQLARLLDANWRIPFTGIRFGFDALVGLLPVVGDSASAVVSLYILLRARRHGAPAGLLAHMAANVLLDTVVGSVPILGSVFDVAYRANIRNVDLLRRHLEQRPRDG